MRMAAMMMTPPMEGTPTFFSPKGSIDLSLAVSVICFLFRNLMKCSPNHDEITKASISANMARKEIYPHKCEPLIPNSLRNLNI